jgi:hypothetical protein
MSLLELIEDTCELDVPFLVSVESGTAAITASVDYPQVCRTTKQPNESLVFTRKTPIQPSLNEVDTSCLFTFNCPPCHNSRVLPRIRISPSPRR